MQTEAQEPLSGAARLAAEQVVVLLARAMKNVSFYEVGHPVVGDVIAEFMTGLNELLKEHPELAIKFVSGYVVVGDRPLVNPHASVGNLVGACHRRGVETMVFRREVTIEEVEHVVSLLASDPAEIEKDGGLEGMLSDRGVRGISIGRLGSRPKGDWQWSYASALDVLRGASMEVRTGHAIDIGSVQLSVRDIVDDIINEGSIVYNLLSMKGMDEYTFIHALHICILAVELGRRIDLPREQLEELGIATLLHDVGKIFVPLEILRKPTALDEEEFAVMSRHPVDGAVVLARESRLPEVTALVAFEHHIHFDHSGYPRLGRPRSLHLYSLMASVVDVYDAMTTMRPYRPPLPPHRALRVMREEYGGRLEPRLLERFFEMLGPHPWGTLLRLPDDRLAAITRPNAAAPDNPFARIVERELERDRLSEEEVPLRALASNTSQLEVVDPIALGLELPTLLRDLPGASLEMETAGVPSQE